MNNRAVYSAGALAYCPDYIENDRSRAILMYYVSIGEEASKAEFADGSMPSL